MNDDKVDYIEVHVVMIIIDQDDCLDVLFISVDVSDKNVCIYQKQ